MGRKRREVERDVRALFERDYPRVAGWAAGALGDIDAGHDIAGEAFYRLMRRFRMVDDPEAYLFAVAANLVRRHWKLLARERQQNEAWARQRATSAGPHEPIGMLDLVLRLPDQQRVAVYLHYYNDLPVEQIALVVDRPVGTVKRWLHEGRARLGEVLETARCV